VAELSSQSAKKIAGLNDANIPEGLQLSQVAVSGNNQIGSARDGAFQNPVVSGVFRNRPQGDRWADNLGDFRREFQTRHDVGFLEMQDVPQHGGEFAKDGGGDEQDEAAFDGLFPKSEKAGLADG
jgi:hypothetical protein